MTDRIHALHVALDRDMRADDVQALMAAIECLRFVAGVTCEAVDFADFAARRRVKDEIGDALMAILSGRKGTP